MKKIIVSTLGSTLISTLMLFLITQFTDMLIIIDSFTYLKYGIVFFIIALLVTMLAGVIIGAVLHILNTCIRVHPSKAVLVHIFNAIITEVFQLFACITTYYLSLTLISGIYVHPDASLAIICIGMTIVGEIITSILKAMFNND